MVGRVAFVTASVKGLGRAFALGLAKHGCDLVIHHRKNPAEAEQTAQEIQALGRRVLIVKGNLNSVATVRQIFAQILASFGRIDIVVNNAGVYHKNPIAEVTEAEFDETFSINTKIPFFIMKECAKHMADNGRIINVTTSFLTVVMPSISTYGGSKAALEHLSKSFAKEVGHRGITVNMVAPGPVNTDMLLNSTSEDTIEAYKAQSPARRVGEVDDIVPVVTFLASPAAQWVSAQTIFVNGGMASR